MLVSKIAGNQVFYFRPHLQEKQEGEIRMNFSRSIRLVVRNYAVKVGHQRPPGGLGGCRGIDGCYILCRNSLPKKVGLI